MTLNRKQIRQKLYELFGAENLGYHSTASARSTTTLTDKTRWGTFMGTYNQEGRLFYFPQGTSPYDIKRIGAVTAGVATIADEAWPDTDTNVYYENIRKDVYPDELNDCIRRALRHVYSPTERPLTIWDLQAGTGDGDFDDASTTRWIQGDAGAAPSISKSNNAAFNLTGYQSLVVVNAAADNYIVHNVPALVAPGERLWLAALAYLRIGTSCSFSVWDADSNSATYNQQIGSTLTAYGNVPQHMGQVYTVPGSGATGCTAINVRLGAASISSQVIWDALPGHSLTNKRFPAPEWVKAGWQLTGFGPTTYDFQIDTNVHTAQSRREYTWKRGNYGDWKPEVMGENSNPRSIKVLRHGDMPACDMWIKGRRQESDHDALTDDSGTTNADEDTLMAACVVEVCNMLKNKGDGQKWDDDIARNQAFLNAQQSLMDVEPDEPEPRYVRVGRWG